MDHIVVLERIRDGPNETMTIDKLRRYMAAFENPRSLLIVGGKVHKARWNGLGSILEAWLLPVGSAKGAMDFANHLFYFTSLLFVGARAAKKKPSIQYVTNTYGHYTLGAVVVVLAKIEGRKAIVRVAGSVREVLARDRLPDKILYLMLSCLERFTFEHADAVMKASPLPLERKYEGKAFEVPYVLEKPPESAPARARAVNSILYVGRLEPEKGVTTLLEAAKILVEKRRDVKLTIVGTGSLENILHEQLERKGLSHHVTMKGFVTHPKVLTMMRRATMLVLPSITDYAPEVVLEAAVNGLPVIATSTGALPYMIHHSRTGILVSPKDPYALSVAIENLLGDPRLRDRIAFAARKSVLRYYSSEETRLAARRVMNFVFSKNNV